MSRMSDKELEFTIDGPVGTMELNRPDDGHRLAPLLPRMKEITAQLKTSRDVHVLIIRGTGAKQFCLGVFGPVRRAAMSKEEALDVVALGNDVIDAIEALPQIVVCGINGELHGGGAELALGCDIRVVAAHAHLAFPEAKMGGFPGCGAAVRLPPLIGRGRALELLCTGRTIDADEMMRIGFADRVVTSDAFDSELDDLAATIGRCGPLATRGAKRVVNARIEPGFRSSRELSDALRQALEYSHDVDEGLAARREGRPPKFLGR
jgi:enoyl-CoA hydratase/carnithine racemase